jgi:hypothetical protein
MRPDAPIGQTPGLREWWARDHLSALSARSPEGKVYVHSQERALHAADVVALLAHLRREGPGRLVVIWDGAPMHRRQTIQDFLANGAPPRLHVERLPADAPARNPDEGCWAQRKGVELRHVCCFNLPHLGHARREAVRRVRRKPRISQGCFKGAGLSIITLWSNWLRVLGTAELPHID